MKNLDKYKNTIIAHRGIHDNIIIPENSLSAFKLAIKENITIEFDIHLTKDNDLIVFHDDTLERMTKNKNIVENLTIKEIKKLNLLNTKEKIPTLEEVLELVKGKVLLDIEIKANTQERKIIEVLLKKLENYKGEVILKSFNPIIVRILTKMKTKYLVGLLITVNSNKKWYNLISKTTITIKYSKPDFLAISKKMINRKNIQKYFNKMPIMVWTIKKKKEIEEINNKDFIYIANNLPYKKD